MASLTPVPPIDLLEDSQSNAIWMGWFERLRLLINNNIISTAWTSLTGNITSAQFKTAVSDETGSGAVVFADTPTLIAPILGTPTSGVLTNATGTAAGLTAGTATVANGLKTATTTVVVSAAVAPIAGQVLTASSTTLADWQTPSAIGGTPIVITVANEATDTTCFPAFFTAATGDLGPKTNANLTFNSNTASLGCTTLDLGGAVDATLARSGAGDLMVESNIIYRAAGTDVPVTDGGTGRSTSTTAYALLASGTTATGIHQTCANGATTEILVGGGAAALPVWTTAEGTGAPVRKGSPTLTTPNIGVATATSLNGHTFTAGSSTFTGTAAQTYTFPATTASIYGSVDAIPAANVPGGITSVRSALFTQSMVAGTYYYVPDSALTMPATSKTGGGMSTSTTMTWTFMIRKTAAGTAAFNVRIFRGTAGTTSDTADVTQSIGTATAVVDIAQVIVQLVVTATGATGSYTWGIAVNHKAATATGFGTTDATPFFEGTVASVAMDTASLKFGIGLMSTTGTTALVLSGLSGHVNNMN